MPRTMSLMPLNRCADHHLVSSINLAVAKSQNITVSVPGTGPWLKEAKVWSLVSRAWMMGANSCRNMVFSALFRIQPRSEDTYPLTTCMRDHSVYRLADIQPYSQLPIGVQHIRVDATTLVWFSGIATTAIPRRTSRDHCRPNIINDILQHDW